MISIVQPARYANDSPVFFSSKNSELLTSLLLPSVISLVNIISPALAKLVKSGFACAGVLHGASIHPSGELIFDLQESLIPTDMLYIFIPSGLNRLTSWSFIRNELSNLIKA